MANPTTKPSSKTLIKNESVRLRDFSCHLKGRSGFNSLLYCKLCLKCCKPWSHIPLSFRKQFSCWLEGPLIHTPHVVLRPIWQLSGECCVLDLEYISYPGLWIIAYKGGVWLVTGVNEFPCNICRDALHMLTIKGMWWKASLSADINCCLHQMPILPPGR